MGVPVFIYGKSGSGKSRSLKNFGENEILYINVENKPLPFRKKFAYVLSTHDTKVITQKLAAMKNAGVKTAIIDDAGYIATDYYMKNHRLNKGSAVFDMYNAIADDMYNLVNAVKYQTDEDTIVYIVMHEEKSDYGDVKLRTLGKQLDRIVCLEGMVTIVIRCLTDDKRHYFKVWNDGYDITKSPEDMFPQGEIENDLKAVDTAIRNYYGWEDTENA